LLQFEHFEVYKSEFDVFDLTEHQENYKQYGTNPPIENAYPPKEIDYPYILRNINQKSVFLTI